MSRSKRRLFDAGQPGHDDLDEQKTGYDGQNNEQIKISFRHLSLRFH